MILHINKPAILLIPALVVLLAVPVAGQNKPYNEEITVIAAFDPIIPDAFKINQNPVIDDTTTRVPAMTYSVMPRDAGIKLEIEQLPAVKLVAEPLTKIYRNYLKAGAGNYSTTYGELFASSLRSKSHLVGVHAKHLSSSGKIKEFGPVGNSTQLAELFGQKYFENHTLSGKVYLEREGLHLYGFKPSDFNDTAFDKDEIKQRYLTTGLDAAFGSRYKDHDRLNHDFGLSYYHLSDKYEVKEDQVKVRADLNKEYDLFHWKTPQLIGLNSSYTFYSQRDSVNSYNSGILNITPTLSARWDEYTFKAGLGFYVGMDTVTKGHLYPMLEARLDLVPDALQLYAGIDGGMERNSVRGLIEKNLYLTSGLPLGFTYNKFRAYGGFSSNISRVFNFNGSISSTTVENNPFFVTDTLNPLLNTFTLWYDDITITRIKAEMEFMKSEKLRLGVTGAYNIYNTDQEYAWYMPEVELGFQAAYNMQEKIILKFQANYTGPVWALTVPDSWYNREEPQLFNLTAKKIDGWIDLNLGMEYRFKKALSFWLNLNNLSNKQHFYWHNYPSYKLNALAGVSYSF